MGTFGGSKVLGEAIMTSCMNHKTMVMRSGIYFCAWGVSGPTITTRNKVPVLKRHEFLTRKVLKQVTGMLFAETVAADPIQLLKVYYAAPVFKKWTQQDTGKDVYLIIC